MVERSEQILSPACGRITEIISTDSDPDVPGNFTRVSIFLAVWDNHVTRSPITGQIESIRYRHGKFGMALFKKNLLKNENNLIWFIDGSFRLAVRQIAGRIARRIICSCRVGQTTQQGQEIGLITFGSCVQLYLPQDVEIKTRVGQKVEAGKTLVASRL